MKILVDTPIWSYAFRSQNEKYQNEIRELISLIKDQRTIIIGPIRQEILSGYSDLIKFQKMREKLSYFENTSINDSDYEVAAEFSNTCRRNGIQGSHIDCLICAVSSRLKVSIFTTDKNFTLYQKIVPIELYKMSH